MAITKEMLDELLKDYRGPEDLTGEAGLLKQLTKALVERAMGAELTEHLGYEKHEAGEKPSENRRNGRSPKTVRSDQGPMTIDVPRDRDGTFEPKIVGKHQRELPGFSDKVLSMYARGMTTREIGEHLKEIYGTEVSPQFITSVTDAVVETLEAWRNRELEAVYPIVFFDAIVVKVRDNGHVVKKGHLPGSGDHVGGQEGAAGAVDRPKRGGQVLAGDHQRAEKPWGSGSPHRRSRRPEWIPGCHPGGLPGYRGSALHRACGAQFLEIRPVPRPADLGRRAEDHLQCTDGRSPIGCPEAVLRNLGWEVPDDWAKLA